MTNPKPAPVRCLEPSRFASRREAREARGPDDRTAAKFPDSVSALYREPVDIPGRVPVKDRPAGNTVIVVRRAGGRS